jgi:hypothetical protein
MDQRAVRLQGTGPPASEQLGVGWGLPCACSCLTLHRSPQTTNFSVYSCGRRLFW